MIFLFRSNVPKKTNCSSIFAFSRKLRNYLPQVQSTEAIFFVLFILLVQLVTPLLRRPHHFCAALMVTHKFRLCLHPRGMLRVQSLHLPIQGLARRFLLFHYTILSASVHWKIFRNYLVFIIPVKSKPPVCLHGIIEAILDDPLEDYRKILIRTTLDDMLQELYRFVSRICEFLDKNINANQSVAERAKAYIEAHYADSGLTLDQVASEMGISPDYFSAQFKRSTGSSFINYLTNVRISHAREYLKSGNYKTYEVALRCGYENPTYFSTIFKRRTVVSPSEYRDA